MSATEHDATRSLRWSIYTLLIVIAAASSSARIFYVSAKDRDPRTPFLSANDRSRWATIRALVDHGTYVIDDIIFDPETGERVQGWHTIDLVKHLGHDGREHYYSSKPVLMPTLMAGVYWLVKNVTGANLEAHPFHAGRIVLWLCNIPPLVMMWWLLARIIDRYGRDDWSRCFALAAATFGTFLTTFSITLNNHLHAAVCVTVTLYAILKVFPYQPDASARERPPTASPLANASGWYAIAGLFSALTFANELPALAFFALVALAAVWCDWRKMLLWFVPPAALVIVVASGLNYVAHGSWRPAYTHRGDGPVIAELQLDSLGSYDVRNGDPKPLVRELSPTTAQPLSAATTLSPRLPTNAGDDVANRYVLWDRVTQQRFAIHLDRNTAEVRAWDDWYDYEGTYWTAERKQGVDRGEPSKLVYAFHCLLGHHGLFSLTPIWLIAFAGMGLACRAGFQPASDSLATAGWKPTLRGTLVLSIVVLAFYLTRPLEDRNYGGWCNGLRWMMWLAPLYLVAMLPALEILARSRWGRGLAIAALAISVFSAAYNPMNPWQHPWLYDYLTYIGWIAY